MTGADDVQVDRHGLIAAERHDFVLLDDAQQSRLQRQRHVADFVEEQCSAAGLQDLAGPSVLRCVGEGAARVAEQLALDQRFRNRGAVDGDERRPATDAAVQDLGERFLAGTGRALQQDRHVLDEELAAAGEVLRICGSSPT